MARSKKDIDRELMYKKILPTAMATDSITDKVARDGGMKETLPQNISAAMLDVSIQTPVEVIISSPSGEGQSQKLPGVKSGAGLTEVSAGIERLPVAEDVQPGIQTPVAPAESPLVNLMEAFVEKRLEAALKKFKCCTCERCRKDVLALTLNKLPPLYVIEGDLDIRDQHERERAAQVATALVQAVLAVKAHPSHEIIR
ncbi:MAG TPA: late competence development ComFB family protein [Clostridia bacterium]|nr:late competence development ComFB family protein [Clostridia bacterium]